MGCHFPDKELKNASVDVEEAQEALEALVASVALAVEAQVVVLRTYEANQTGLGIELVAWEDCYSSSCQLTRYNEANCGVKFT